MGVLYPGVQTTGFTIRPFQGINFNELPRSKLTGNYDLKLVELDSSFRFATFRMTSQHVILREERPKNLNVANFEIPKH